MYLIDVAIPGGSRLSSKTIEKLTKYVELKIEISRMWRPKKVSVIPIIIGALGSVPVDLLSYSEMLTLPSSLILDFQRTVLFRTTSTLRRYMNI